jgi:hypothetical protein
MRQNLILTVSVEPGRLVFRRLNIVDSVVELVSQEVRKTSFCPSTMVSIPKVISNKAIFPGYVAQERNS